MLLEMNIIEGSYLQDILDQPEALRRSLAGFHETGGLREFARALSGGTYKRIVLTGMGSSLFALYPLHLTLTGLGYPVLLVETSELIHYLEPILDSQTLVVAVSQSGQSAEVVRLVKMTRWRAPLIAVTNNADSCLATQSDAHVLIQAGPESSVSCKTYVSSLLALEWLGAVLSGGDLPKMRNTLALSIPAVEEYLSRWRRHVAELSSVVADVEQIFVTGRGSSLSTAQTGGLILKESARFPAEGMSCAAFRHGPFEMLRSSIFVLVMAGDSRSEVLNRRLAADVEQAGGKAALVDTNAKLGAFRIPQVPDLIRVVLEILPVQMISLALAARTGREAGRFELATKVTAIE